MREAAAIQSDHILTSHVETRKVQADILEQQTSCSQRIKSILEQINERKKKITSSN